MKNKRRVLTWIVVTALLLAMLLPGCSTPDAAPTGTQNQQKPTGETNTTKPTEGEIALTSSEFAVTPQTVRFLGRHHADPQSVAYGFYNAAAGITFQFIGTSLELEMFSSMYQNFNLNYVAVTIDDGEPIAICVDHDGWYTVAEGLEDGVRHTVTVCKRTMSNAGAVYIRNVRLSEGARLFYAPATTEHRIQVLGDSITCGYGTLWDGSNTEEVTKWQDGANSYAVMTAKRLNAELEVIAISGIGVGNSECRPYPLMPSYLQEDMQNNVECDFTAYIPEVVIIALGTNDDGQGNPPEVFQANGRQMIRFIRNRYPDAVIVWTYGAMGSASYKTAIQDMVAQLNAEGDSNVYFLPTSRPLADEPYGQHGHPGQKSHERMADELTEFICRITGWTDYGK